MNIAMLLDMAADGLGDRVAFGPRGEGISYARLRDIATRIAAHVNTAGAHTVALVGETSPLVPAALFGAAWAGASYAPINYRLPDEARLELLHRLRPAEVATDAWLDADASDNDGPSATAFPDEPQRPAVLLYTSGTSAAPKAAVLQHDQVLAYILNTVEFAAADDDESVLLAVPPFHVAGVALVHGMPDDVVTAMRPDQRTAVVALTHDPKLDDLALMEALKSDAFYVGAIGSRANNAKRHERLKLFDVSDVQLAKLHGPIGVYIGSKMPSEIAVSILAEMTAVKNGVRLNRLTEASEFAVSADCTALQRGVSAASQSR